MLVFLKKWYRSQWWEGGGVKPATTVEIHNSERVGGREARTTCTVVPWLTYDRRGAVTTSGCATEEDDDLAATR